MVSTIENGNETSNLITRRHHSSMRLFFWILVVSCLISLKLSPSQMMLQVTDTKLSNKPTFINETTTTIATMVAAQGLADNVIQQSPVWLPKLSKTSGQVDANTTASSNHHISLYNVSNIPRWMMDYFAWHRRQLDKLHSGELAWWNPDHNTSARFLILRCIDGDRCGGTSDRLKAFPLFLFMAMQSNRILLIRWSRPFAMEEFLKPRDIWNWTVPEALLQYLEEQGDDKDSAKNKNNTQQLRVYYDGTQFKYLRQSSLNRSIWLVEGNDYSGGETRYQRLVQLELKRRQQESSNWRRHNAEYASFYHDLFHASFRPSPAVEEQLKGYIQETDGGKDNNQHLPELLLPIRLQPNGYMVAHYRAKYPGEPYRQSWNTSILEQRALYAVNCARQRGGSNRRTVYMASDTALALEAVYKVFSHQNETLEANSDHVWSCLNLQSSETRHKSSNQSGPIQFAVDPPHLNFAELDDPLGFYGIFVDLFLMSYSYCVVYGAGGFGRFGALVSFHPHCGAPFTSKNASLRTCEPYQGNH